MPSPHFVALTPTPPTILIAGCPDPLAPPIETGKELICCARTLPLGQFFHHSYSCVNSDIFVLFLLKYCYCLMFFFCFFFSSSLCLGYIFSQPLFLCKFEHFHIFVTKTLLLFYVLLLFFLLFFSSSIILTSLISSL